jgi:hypothetical protein
LHVENIISQHTYNQSADACDISPIAPNDTNTLHNINFTPAFLPTTSTCITDSDAETQMPDIWLYNCFSDDESLNESMNFDSVIFMKECTSVGSQTLFMGESIFLDFKAPSFCPLNRSNHIAQTQTCQATYYFSQLYDG